MTRTLQKTLLDVRNLTVERQGRVLLRNVDITLGRGEMVALVGRNGAGKSTLLRALVGVCAGSGSLFFEGVDLRDLSPRERAQRIAYLPQHIDIPVGLTSYDYIALGRHPWRSAVARWSTEDRRWVDEAIERAGVQGFLGRALLTLSGGERQRVYLAAALAQRARLLLLDEPSAALDPVQRADLWALLSRVRSETEVAILAATHDIDRAPAVVDRVVALTEGAVSFDGDSARFLSGATLGAVYGGPVGASGVLQ